MPPSLGDGLIMGVVILRAGFIFDGLAHFFRVWWCYQTQLGTPFGYFNPSFDFFFRPRHFMKSEVANFWL